MMTLIQIGLKFFQFMSGQFSAIVYGIIMVIAFMKVAGAETYRPLFHAFIGCAGGFAVSWIITYFYGGTIGA